jgi:hypothetical protein
VLSVTETIYVHVNIIVGRGKEETPGRMLCTHVQNGLGVMIKLALFRGSKKGT